MTVVVAPRSPKVLADLRFGAVVVPADAKPGVAKPENRNVVASTSIVRLKNSMTNWSTSFVYATYITNALIL